MAKNQSDTGEKRAKRWNLNVKHGLYRETGNWYQQLRRFPGALLDANGYLIFETEEAYRSCPELQIRKQIGVPRGISNIPGYVLINQSALPYSYEKAVLEGARIDVLQSRPERDHAARDACIKEHGYACAACGIDFGKRYGDIGKGFIHIHHLVPLATGERLVSGAKDMRPLCPNCHAMVHRRNPPLSIPELQALIKSN